MSETEIKRKITLYCINKKGMQEVNRQRMQGKKASEIINYLRKKVLANAI